MIRFFRRLSFRFYVWRRDRRLRRLAAAEAKLREVNRALADRAIRRHSSLKPICAWCQPGVPHVAGHGICALCAARLLAEANQGLPERLANQNARLLAGAPTTPPKETHP